MAGSFNSGSDDSISIDGDVDAQASITISLEHPIPVLPNIKFQTRDLSSTGTDSDFNGKFKDESFASGGVVSSTLDLSHQDIVLYYELLDNWVNLDLGINLKTFDGEATVSNNSDGSSTITIDETIPLLYLSARIDLPFTGFYVGADIQNLSLNDSAIEDSTILVGYETSSGFGIEGGYKKFSLNLDDVSSLNTTIEYDGLYINGYFHF